MVTVQRIAASMLQVLMVAAARLQTSDGAGAVLLMTRREALRRSLPILGVFRSFAAVGVDPAIMGIGPSVRLQSYLHLKTNPWEPCIHSSCDEVSKNDLSERLKI